MTYPDRAAVDTNVLIVANGRNTHARPECISHSVRFLLHASQRCVLLLDSGWQILHEYQNKCNSDGQPGPGDRFLLQLLRTHADPRRVRKVSITLRADGTYEEVPGFLRNFDPADQKFVAVVVADGKKATIVNSTDSDWANESPALKRAGINVHELCGCRPRSKQGST